MAAAAKEKLHSSHGLCSYELGDKRCSLPGVFSYIAKAPRWYCWIHDAPENRLPPGPDAEEALAWILEHRAELVRTRYARPAWEVEAVRDPFKGGSSRSQLVRGEFESRSEYTQRMLAWLCGRQVSPAAGEART